MRARIIHLAFMVSVFVYGITVMVLRRQGEFRPASDPQFASLMVMILPCLYALGVAVHYLIVSRLPAQTEGERLTRHLVRLAFFETGPIYGLVLFFLTGNADLFYAFGAVGLFLMAAHPPARE